MRATAEPVEGNTNTVKLSVEVEEDEFEKALTATFRRLSREARIPGFRPGKAPRRLLEARIGAKAVRQEALQEALPGYYADAVAERELDPIAPPDIEVTGGEETGPVSFDAVVQLRPHPSIAGYTGLQVTVPSLEVSDDEVTAQVDRLRDQFGELSPVSRKARDGDHVTIDVKGYRHSETIEGLSADDLLVEVGTGAIVPQLDEHLRGAAPGDIFKFNATVPSPDASGGEEEVSFQILVKDVKEKVLPAADDEWASEASEFDTLEELRADLAERLGSLRRANAQLALRENAVVALSDLVEEDIPDVMVDEEMERRLHDLGHRLEAQNVSVADYLAATGRDQEQYLAELRETATRSVRADLALRALAEAESIEVSDEELDAELARMAEEAGRPAARLRQQLDRAGRLPAVRSDMRTAKALGWLLEHVDLVDEEGRPVDRAAFQLGGPAGAEPADGEADGDESSAREEQRETTEGTS